MKNSISVRQICFILLAYGAAVKLMVFPAALANAAGNDLLFPLLFDTVVQTVVIWAVAYLSSRTDKTFFELIENTLGKVTARIVYGLLALWFLMSAVLPVSEQQLLVHDAFYDTIPAIYVFLPFFFFSVYAGAKSFTNVGRCADFCFPIFIVTIAGFLIMSLGQGEYSNLLPVLRQPFSKIAGVSLTSSFRFTESAFLLLFMGHFKYRKGDAAKLTVSYVAGELIVMLLIAAYYALYGQLASSRAFLLESVAEFFPAVSVIGRVDLIMLYALDMVILFAIILNIQACVHCLVLAFGWEKRSVWSLLVNAVLLVLTFVLNNKFAALQAVASKWFWVPALVFAYLLPLLAWTLRRRKR